MIPARYTTPHTLGAVHDTPQLAPAREPASVRDGVRILDLEERRVRAFDELPAMLRAGDLLVVNDAATWPASLRGSVRGHAVELRLTTGAFGEGERVRAVVFGDGDWRTRTEDRPAPPVLALGDEIAIADTSVTVTRVDHPRLVEIEVPDVAKLMRAGRPVQYAHVARPLASWDVWTSYAGRPWAVEMPSAGRPLSWRVLRALEARGVKVAALTHAAGLSSTGDAALDATLPWRERFDLPDATWRAIVEADRVIAVGTTVVRALESATGPGIGETDLILSGGHRRRVVDGVLSGLHDPHESHFRLLEAFAPRGVLLDGWRRARAHGLRGHELGDVQLVLSRTSIGAWARRTPPRRSIR